MSHIYIDIKMQIVENDNIIPDANVNKVNYKKNM